MTKSKRTKDILQKILESLIYDIAAGYGTDVLPCPTGDDVSGAAAESAQEIAQLWYGAQELSKYELLAHILAFCSTGDLAPQIASVVMYHYPEAETRLTAKAMTKLMHLRGKQAQLLIQTTNLLGSMSISELMSTNTMVMQDSTRILMQTTCQPTKTSISVTGT